MKKTTLALCMLAIAACGGTGNDAGPIAAILPDKMAGCYATKKDTPADFRIEKQAGQYYASFRKSDGWKREDEALSQLAPEELKKALKKDADKVDMAIAYPKGGFALFRFKKGATVEKKDPNSDFIALIFIGAGPVYQTNCP